MSNAVFPTMAGMVLVDRIPMNTTKVQASSTRMEQRVAMRPSVLYRYTLKNECLRTTSPDGNEYLALQSFFNARQGRFDSFLYVDPVTAAQVRVRFDDDELPFHQYSSEIWSVDDFDLVQVP